MIDRFDKSFSNPLGKRAVNTTIQGEVLSVIGWIVGAVTTSVVIFASAGTAADYRTVQDLLRDCEGPGPGKRVTGGAYCLGVLSGAYAVMLMNCFAIKEGARSDLVAGAGAMPSLGAAEQAFVNWARANPAEWGQMEGLGAALALSEAFPCGN